MNHKSWANPTKTLFIKFLVCLFTWLFVYYLSAVKVCTKPWDSNVYLVPNNLVWDVTLSSLIRGSLFPLLRGKSYVPNRRRDTKINHVSFFSSSPIHTPWLIRTENSAFNIKDLIDRFHCTVTQQKNKSETIQWLRSRNCNVIVDK